MAQLFRLGKKDNDEAGLPLSLPRFKSFATQAGQIAAWKYAFRHQRNLAQTTIGLSFPPTTIERPNSRLSVAFIWLRALAKRARCHAAVAIGNTTGFGARCKHHDRLNFMCSLLHFKWFKLLKERKSKSQKLKFKENSSLAGTIFLEIFWRSNARVK